MTFRHRALFRAATAAALLCSLATAVLADIVPTPAQRAARDRAFHDWIVAEGHPCRKVVASRKISRREGRLPIDSSLHAYRADCPDRSYFIYTEHLKPGHWVKPVDDGE